MKMKSGGIGILIFYGMTKDPETKEFIMIVQFADEGNLRSIHSTNFSSILWKDKDFHSGNILQQLGTSYLSDFGLSRPADEQK